jgi:putative hydrolase of the HAD superfamily
MKIKVAALDIGGVLADIDRDAIKSFLKDDEQVAVFYKDFHCLELGRIEASKYILSKSRLLSCCPRALYLAFKQMLIANSNANYLGFLKTSYLFVSNINSLHYRYFIEGARASSYAIENSITSFQSGLKKPNPAFFEHLLIRTGIPSFEIAYIDDQASNIEVARQLGFSAHLCRAKEDFPDLLQTLDLLPSSFTRDKI